MQLVIGLGNPGKEHEKNRHNVGFMALDNILKDRKPISCASKFDAKICEIHDPQKTLFVYPETYMNSSGKAVRQIMNFYKLTPSDIIVIHDDVDIPLEQIKFTEDSGSAGHNGVKSIIEELGTTKFRRLRVGVETRMSKEQIPTDAFVLQDFTDDEMRRLPLDTVKYRVLTELEKKF